jgi:hypothetical protein
MTLLGTFRAPLAFTVAGTTPAFTLSAGIRIRTGWSWTFCRSEPMDASLVPIPVERVEGLG